MKRTNIIIRSIAALLALSLLSGCTESQLQSAVEQIVTPQVSSTEPQTAASSSAAELSTSTPTPSVAESDEAVQDPEPTGPVSSAAAQPKPDNSGETGEELDEETLRGIFSAWLLKNAAEYVSDAYHWEVEIHNNGSAVLSCYGLNGDLQTFLYENGQVSWGQSGDSVETEIDAEYGTTIRTDPSTGLKMEVMVRYESDLYCDGAVFHFVEPVSRECGYGGDLWWIYQYTVEGFCSTYELESAEWLQSLPGVEEYMLAKDEVYVYVLRRPGDVRYDPDNETSRDSYRAYRDASRAMLESFISLNGLERTPYFDAVCP